MSNSAATANGESTHRRWDWLDWRNPDGVDLPPGSYRMFWSDARGEVQQRRITLRAGERPPRARRRLALPRPPYCC
jgi:hypothetical protein